jgi:hypothetical protein
MFVCRVFWHNWKTLSVTMARHIFLLEQVRFSSELFSDLPRRISLESCVLKINWERLWETQDPDFLGVIAHWTVPAVFQSKHSVFDPPQRINLSSRQRKSRSPTCARRWGHLGVSSHCFWLTFLILLASIILILTSHLVCY